MTPSDGFFGEFLSNENRSAEACTYYSAFRLLQGATAPILKDKFYAKTL